MAGGTSRGNAQVSRNDVEGAVEGGMEGAVEEGAVEEGAVEGEKKQPSYSPNPVEQASDSPNPVEQLSDSSNLEQLSDSSNPVEQLSDSPNPVEQLSDSPNPVEQLSDSPNPVEQLSDSPNPVEQLSDSPNPVNSSATHLTQVRGWKKSGPRVLLEARAFCARENNVPVQPSAIENAATVQKEYSQLVEGSPDPLQFKDEAWLPEAEGLEEWPNFMYYDYLMKDHPARDLGQKERFAVEPHLFCAALSKIMFKSRAAFRG
ncbi:Hypp6173 [Branchiostoma lanceolatum]|uniref:Hypp6173 protein n=1 Tax=Branchiostoma lanceolatum TaxID=7740 RepID=A0A8J9W8Y1_BRALA|nr:Hypp6173 [Branchiostoma lanceolatum]